MGYGAERVWNGRGKVAFNGEPEDDYSSRNNKIIRKRKKVGTAPIVFAFYSLLLLITSLVY